MPTLVFSNISCRILEPYTKLRTQNHDENDHWTSWINFDKIAVGPFYLSWLLYWFNMPLQVDATEFLPTEARNTKFTIKLHYWKLHSETVMKLIQNTNVKVLVHWHWIHSPWCIVIHLYSSTHNNLYAPNTWDLIYWFMRFYINIECNALFILGKKHSENFILF